MLQFLKKTGRRKSIAGSDSNDSTAVAIASGTDPAMVAHQRKSDDVRDAVNILATDNEALCLAERYCLESKDSCVGVPKLSRRMGDILGEHGSMGFFVQYMESRKALALVKCWLDIECFKTAAYEIGRPKTISSHAGQGLTSKLHKSISSDGYDCPPYSSVNLDSFSMNSCSENILEDRHSSDDVRVMMDSTMLHSCTPASATPFELVEEAACNEEIMSIPLGDEEQSVVHERTLKQLDICDITMHRQSLTDDEKSQICEAGKGASAEGGSGASSKIKLETSNIFDPMINSDAVRIYKKYFFTNSPHYIEVPATIVSTISLTLCSGACSSTIFNEVQQFLQELLERNYLNLFLESSFYCNYTLEVLTSKNLRLVDILGSEMALFYFMEYLEQQKKRHYLECYVAAVHFKQSFENKAQAQKDALVLYEKYFSLQATCSLRLSDNVRLKLEEQICSPDPTNIALCFELPVQIIERFLEQRFLVGFIASSLYKRFLNDLHGKVNTNLCNSASSMNVIAVAPTEISEKGYRKTLSDGSSDRKVTIKRGIKKTISSQNTLLAMSDTNFQRNRRELVTNAIVVASNIPATMGVSGSAGRIDIMQIDSRQLHNPDLLWRRNTSRSGLTFGRVDALGRYERDVDIAGPPTADDRWNSNKIKNAVRKLVNLPEDKVQEELAWQVAEMIVKDITSITMHKKS